MACYSLCPKLMRFGVGALCVSGKQVAAAMRYTRLRHSRGCVRVLYRTCATLSIRPICVGTEKTYAV